MRHDQRFVGLDLIRGLAAVAVCAEHARHVVLVDHAALAAPSPAQQLLYAATGLGHEAVVAFFVMSGFFVGGALLRHDGFDARAYALARLTRLTRLWGVLLPVLPRRRGVVYVSVHRYPQGQMRLYGRIDLLLRAFAAVPPALRMGWRVVVVGPHAVSAGGGGPEFLAGLQRLAHALGVDADWAGPVFDRAALNRWYARAGVFVYPSTAARGEALPLAPLEAMAQGCPVVTSDLPCFGDYLEPGRNGDMFALGEGDPAPRLAAALAALLGDAARRRRHSAAALATVQRFTLPRVAEAFLADFAQLCGA